MTERTLGIESEDRATPAPEPVRAGATLAGRYRLDRELGRGGMGQVFAAHDLRLDRKVAIKLLLGGGSDAERLSRFEQEARAAGGINHPNIVTVHDVIAGDGGPCIISEFLEGDTLHDLLARGPLTPERAADLARQLAEGLVAAHGKGVVHRDLKPANLFVSREGRLKILDFGIAKLLEPGAEGPRTQSGAVLGTVGYMSPEQIQGEPADARSDLFSAGVILHEMLAGSKPFSAPSQHRIEERILHAEPDALPASVPAALARIVHRCLEKKPSRRFQSARELSENLSSFLSQVPANVSLLDDLKRRRVFRALFAWGVVAFATLQIIEPIMHGLRWPEAVLSYLVVALAAGFPLVVGLAWIFDVNGGRVKWAAPVARSRRVRVAATLAGIGLLAAAPGIAWYFLLRPGARALKVDQPLQAAADKVVPASDLPAPPSIAVLPLLNLSRDPEQEYFADGLAEELLNLLAKVPGLRVVARTSAFAFKGKSIDLRSIGQQLNVSHILEGSVRRSGDRLRISTRLSSTSDGYRVWSETYDRKLIDVFTMQDQIATAVVGALKLKLVRKPDSSERRTAIPAAYNQYLLGRQFFLRSNLDDFRRAVEAYRKAVELDPAYAPAWAGLANATYWVAEEEGSAQAIAAGFEKARAAAEKAVALGPDLSDGYRARGALRAAVDWQWEAAAADLKRALALDPENADALSFYAGAVLRPTGRLAEAEAFGRKAIALDPLNPRFWGALGGTLLYLGKTGPAREALNRSLEISPAQSFTALNVALSLLIEGRPAEALAISQRSTTEIFRLMGAALADHDLGHAEESGRLLDQMVAKFAHSDAYQIAEVHAWRGEQDRAFEWLERARAQRDGGLLMVKVDPLLRRLRGDPRWRRLLESIHLPVE